MDSWLLGMLNLTVEPDCTGYQHNYHEMERIYQACEAFDYIEHDFKIIDGSIKILDYKMMSFICFLTNFTVYKSYWYHFV